MSSILRTAAIAAGLSYLVFVAVGAEATALTIAWKGAGVALLAAWAFATAAKPDDRIIAAVMACGAAGDVLLETHGLTIGALAFATGHVIAIWLYTRNIRARIAGSQLGAAVALAIGTPVIAWLLTGRLDILVYATMLGGMAASAWLSRFSRYTAGIGAVLFVASDLLIFARMGPLAGVVWASVAIWLLYFAGQYLITAGVIAAPAKPQALP
jgi:uncharacterized membrane protein YhhN